MKDERKCKFLKVQVQRADKTCKFMVLQNLKCAHISVKNRLLNRENGNILELQSALFDII